MKKLFLLITLSILFSSFLNAQKKDTTIILTFDMKEEVAPALWRKTQKAFEMAEKEGARLIIIHMNTYGGMVVSADSIRTLILNSKIPVYVFIDNNAASAGALISVACDKIFMRPGGNIGAATVVNQTGEQMPDKYQSYMRSTMRATAEAQGKDTIINGNDTTYKWKRDPHIAEAMVDADLFVEGVSDTGKVITFTANEAVQNGFCEGIVDNMAELIEKEALNPVVIKEYKPTSMEKLIGLLVSPVFQSLLIMAIFGGLYFELQTPGVGFPLAAAVLAAILYFAPLYLEGIAANWEIAIFIVGIILIGIEIFAIPGFGVAGIAGITLAVLGLSLAMVDSFNFEFEGAGIFAQLMFSAMLLVLGSLFVSIVLSIILSQRMFSSSFFGGKIALKTVQTTTEGYSSANLNLKLLIGKTGIAETVLRPSGSIIIDDELHDAMALYGFIDKNQKIKVVKYESNQLYVVKSE